MSLLTIFLGYFLKRTNLLKTEDSTVLSKIILNLTFPALILLSMSSTEISADFLILPFLPVLSGSIGLGMGFLLFHKANPLIKGQMLMSAMGLNIGLFAFPIIEGLYGSKGLQTAALVDVGNALMIFGLSYLLGAHFSPDHKGRKRGIGGTLLVFLKSVPFMAYMLGLAISFSPLDLPSLVLQWLNVAGKANQFLVLLVLGLTLSFDWRKHIESGILKLFLLRYAIGFIFCFLVLIFLPIDDPVIRKVAALSMILPVGFAVIPFSIEFGYDRETAGALVNISLIISFFIMWGLAILL